MNLQLGGKSRGQSLSAGKEKKSRGQSPSAGRQKWKRSPVDFLVRAGDKSVGAEVRGSMGEGKKRAGKEASARGKKGVRGGRREVRGEGSKRAGKEASARASARGKKGVRGGRNKGSARRKKGVRGKRREECGGVGCADISLVCADSTF